MKSIFKKFLLLSVLVAHVISSEDCGIRKFNPGRIVGGNEAKKNQFPWTVALQYFDGDVYEHFCGAVILNERWILTAAHCFNWRKIETVRAVIGSIDLTSKEFEFTTNFEKLVTHNAYNRTTFENDIALLKTAKIIAIDKKKINRICLPKADEQFSGFGNVSGWGRIGEDDDTSDQLKFLEINLYSDIDCKEVYNDTTFFEEKMLCAGFIRGNRDACQGDSGGPLEKLIDNKVYLIGIVSNGQGCAQELRPGVYTEVSHYVNWIKDQMQEKLSTKVLASDESHRITDTTTFCGIRKKFNRGRIVNGRPAKRNEFPWTVSLQKLKGGKYIHFCGAVIINERWILTAAHCVDSLSKVERIRAVIGVSSLANEKDFEFSCQIETIIMHEAFDYVSLVNDIALLKTSEFIPIDVKKENINNICLPKFGEKYSDQADISGWGSIKQGANTSDKLLTSTINVYSDTLCNEVYNDGRFFSKEMLCAGFIDGRSDACDGDSGGPLQKVEENKVYLIGIVSFGEGCARQHRPGVYTEVSHYVNWVKQKIGENRNELPTKMIAKEENIEKNTNKKELCGLRHNVIHPITLAKREAYISEFPWITSLQYLVDGEYKHFCGAVIINKHWLLTSAHCLNWINENTIRAVIGVGNLENKNNFLFSSKIDKIVIHQAFDKTTFENDIALLKTEEIIPFDTTRKRINSICLPQQGEAFSDDADTLGWALITKYDQTAVKKVRQLFVSKIQLYDDYYCTRVYRTQYFLDLMLCSGFKITGSENCGVDFAEHLEKVRENRAYLIGIRSFGNQCGPRAGVYTKVSHYVNWIKQQVKIDTYE